MSNLPDVIHWSRTLLFADDTKYFKHIKSHDDEQSLQTDLHDLASRSVTPHLSFNPSKSIHVSFNQTISTSYNIRGNPINTTHRHKDSDNLNWNIHHDAILSKAYRTLGLVRRSFSSTISTSAKVKLYTSLVRSQVLYCSPVWRPYLIKYIKKLEQLQHRATKYILSDYISDYKTQLIHLRLLPLMYIFEISDILFFIKNFKHSTNNFNIKTYVSFTVSNTRSCGLKLRHKASSTNKEHHFYFNRIICLWNSNY